MNIHEHQAKELLARHGVPVPAGRVANSGAEARAAAAELGGRAVIKAQVHAGARGKGGGIKIAADPAEAESMAAAMLGTYLVTPQTGPKGAPVDRVLAEQALDIAAELYLSILVDGTLGCPVVIASARGGMEIERLAEEEPDAILRQPVHPNLGLMPYQARGLARGLGVESALQRPLAELILNLYAAFERNDCTLVEINPLVVTAGGELLAADAKVNIEDDALFRHAELKEMRDLRQMEPLEKRAVLADLSYVKLDGGQVGCMVNGAGLAMATMDITSTAGANPANFLDIGGSARQESIEEAFRIVLADGDVKAVLVNLFAGIARADVVARGIVAAAGAADSCPPIVVAMRGTNAEEGTAILKAASLPISIADDLADATEVLRGVLEGVG